MLECCLFRFAFYLSLSPSGLCCALLSAFLAEVYIHPLVFFPDAAQSRDGHNYFRPAAIILQRKAVLARRIVWAAHSESDNSCLKVFEPFADMKPVRLPAARRNFSGFIAKFHSVSR